MSYDGRALANQLLDLSDQFGLALTHMAVHKILFYAHGWYLALYGVPLVKQPFEAWEHGPVIQSVFNAFKGSGKKPITGRALRFDPISEKTYVVTADMSIKTVDFMANVLRAYGHLSAIELSDLTHRKGGSWDAVWNAPSGKINLGMTIGNDAIREDFLFQASEAKNNRFKEEIALDRLRQRLLN
jgi:uncharacterized phage-associated protein